MNVKRTHSSLIRQSNLQYRLNIVMFNFRLITIRFEHIKRLYKQKNNVEINNNCIKLKITFIVQSLSMVKSIKIV